MRGIKEDSGEADYYQSHKHNLSVQAINAFLRMAVSNSIEDGLSFDLSRTHKKVTDILLRGMLAMRADDMEGRGVLKRMNPATNLLDLPATFTYINQEPNQENANPPTGTNENNPQLGEIRDEIRDADNELHTHGFDEY